MTDDSIADDAANFELFLEITRDLLAAFKGTHTLKLRLPGVPGWQQSYEVTGKGPQRKEREIK